MLKITLVLNKLMLKKGMHPELAYVNIWYKPLVHPWHRLHKLAKFIIPECQFCAFVRGLLLGLVSCQFIIPYLHSLKCWLIGLKVPLVTLCGVQ